MKIKPAFQIIFLLFTILFCSFIIPGRIKILKEYSNRPFKMPYQEAHLTEREAAAHLLSRFTYGARPGDVDLIVKMGLKNWFEQQLEGNLPEDSTLLKFNLFNGLNLSNAEIVRLTPNRKRILEMAAEDGLIDRDSIKSADKNLLNRVIREYEQKKGFFNKEKIINQLTFQKILRARYSQNQLREVMTDFWFNHFNISVKGEGAVYIPNFEKYVIRPGVFGNFQDLLLATAQSPAMLYYLDNFKSSFTDTNAMAFRNQVRKPKKIGGLNENYAREIMELHTLGVDGGYTQSDVTQAARVLTGWTIFPFEKNGEVRGVAKQFEMQGEVVMANQGYVHKGDFLFDIKKHDIREKKVLGHIFPAGGGYQEGLILLSLLAHHPSTAHFICKELAIRFVNDNPSKTLVDELAKTFVRTNGNIKQVLITLVSLPEFWNQKSSIRQKTKSPLEYMASALRSLNVMVDNPNALSIWLTRMGQQIYHYQAPTGFPDKGEFWINTGSLLNRMNFGLSLSTGKIGGISLDLLALNNNHEPESNQAALSTYSSIIMPERDLEPTLKRLTPLINTPDLNQNLEIRSKNNSSLMQKDEMGMNNTQGGKDINQETESNDSLSKPVMASGIKNTTSLAQVVGIIIGSPEFQRR